MRFTILLASLTALAPIGAVRAQLPDGVGDSPTVVSVEIEGAEAIDAEVLKDSIVTQPTRCRGLLLRPLCAISDLNFFVETHQLDPEELARDALRLRVVYFRRGYRQAEVESSVVAEDDGVAVTFTVDEGPVTRVASRTVTQTDSVLSSGAVAAADLPSEGDPLDLTRLDSARIRLRQALWDRGHADAVIGDSTAIDPATHAADLRIIIDPGPLVLVGEIVVEGNERVSGRTVRRLLDLPPGEPYRRVEMAAAQRRLIEMELFRQALVRVPATTDSVKTVVVSVREAPPRAVRLGVGFNTTDFVQAEAGFTRYNWLGGARRLDLRAAVGNLLAPQLEGKRIFGAATPTGIGEDVRRAYFSPTWQIGLELTQPFLFSTRSSLGVSLSAHRRSIPGIVIDQGASARASVTRRLAESLTTSLSYQFERTDVEAGELYFCVNFGVCDPRTAGALGMPHRLSPLQLTARVERVDDPLAATDGYQARVELEHASRLTASDFHYQRAAGEVARYLRVGERGVLAGHVRAGWVRPLAGTPDALGVPGAGPGILHPRRRLYSGGSRSVRGYGENQLGPRILTIPAGRLIAPPDSTGVPPCTATTVADATCDPEAAPSDAFDPIPLGGNTLIEGSLEYRLMLGGSFVVAAFVDAGLLHGQRVNFPPGSRSAVTPGMGIRYRSPIGPVRMDLALRPGKVEDLAVVTQVEGPDGEPRLLQLERLKRYDPRAGRGGVSRFLSRLQLHLAIGEAF